jgi:hypothetical protein
MYPTVTSHGTDYAGRYTRARRDRRKPGDIRWPKGPLESKELAQSEEVDRYIDNGAVCLPRSLRFLYSGMLNRPNTSKPSGSGNRSDKRGIRRDQHHHPCITRFHLCPCIRNWPVDRWPSVGAGWKVRSPK